MTYRYHGTETEYAFAVEARGDPLEWQEQRVERLMDRARARWRHLPSSYGGGIYLTNGARFYIDTGAHPEYCTPEVLDPAEAVQHVLAGDALLGELVDEVNGSLRRPRVRIFKSNVDYVNKTTWAAHESYAHRASQTALVRGLTAHLVSRVYTGAGGLNPWKAGIHFTLSPRSHFISAPVSEASTCDRAIYHTKNEALAGSGWHRLHVLCGDSTFGQTGIYLKLATTALVVVLVEAGLATQMPQLANPVAALHTLVDDPTFKTTVATAEHGPLTLPGIQRKYLALAQAHLDHPLMPTWAPQACELWHDTLGSLEAGDGAVVGGLDWVLKREMFARHVARRGFEPQSQDVLNAAMASLSRVWQERKMEGPLDPVAVLSARSPVRDAVEALGPALAQVGMTADCIPAYSKLRSELCEIDLRLSEIGRNGLASTLSRPGDRALVTPDQVREAKAQPPRSGRAHHRGRAIDDLAGRDQCAAEWNGVWDQKAERYLDLADPTAASYEWKTIVRREPSGWTAEDPVARVLEEARLAYLKGAYAKCSQLLSRVPVAAMPLASATRSQFLTSLAWARARCGDVEGAIASLCDLTGPGPLRFDGVKNHLCVLRFAGLVPPLDRVESLISQGDRMLSSVNRLDPEGAAAFLCYKGYLLLRAGRPAEARTALTQAMDPSRALRTSRYLMSRILADLGEACRVLGDVEAAERYLDQAQDMQTRRGFQGELADTTLTYRAKLHRDTPARSRLLLRRAKQIQVSLGNHFALVRTLLLEARLARMPWMARRRRDMVVGLRDGIPALRDCPTLTRILQGWDEWACALDRPATEGQDFFWNL